MLVQMDNISAPLSRELAQQLYDKNIGLENRRKKSAQARVPSDPNAWQQMRENFEAIVLEDYAFSEQHNIEYALWQLHYKRIEELRGHFSAALASAATTKSQGGKVPIRPDRTTKIRLLLKTFLSEATGFYHDLILKIKVKHGLPLGNFSEDSESGALVEKGGKKSTEAKQGRISCHRCLIYLGDLARYKGLYAEGDSKSRDYVAASSYYLQAASIWPSSGNSHHQLAILASYSDDELVAVYRYFRSLSVESPFATAKDNLIVAFEKNRKTYSQLLEVSKDSGVKESTLADRVSNMHEIFKAFCIRFVRLNGILFTRNGLETFAGVLSFVGSSLCQLLSSGPEEDLYLGRDAVECGLLIVRLVSMLIFAVHSVNRVAEGQSYAEILQRTALLQNAFAAVYEFMGHLVKRCLHLRNISSSYLLPGILVFVEWLACCPDVASGSNTDEEQANVRSLFWNHCIPFLNKLLSENVVSVDNEDESCFFNMSKYEEGETGNRVALWEDFELRGFLPLLPAQSILDFSRNNSFAGKGNKEEKARVKRILAAGKVLTNVVRVNKKSICFNSNLKKFIIEGEVLEAKSSMVKSNAIRQESPVDKIADSGIMRQSYMDADDDDDEEIVFKPTLTEKRTDVIGAVLPQYINPSQQANSNAKSQPLSVSAITPQHLQPIESHASKWLMEQQVSLANGINGLGLMEQQVSLANGMNGLGLMEQQVSLANGMNGLGLMEQQVSLANGMNGLGLMGTRHVTKMVPQQNTGISQAFMDSSYIAAQQSLDTVASGISYGKSNVPEISSTSRFDNVASTSAVMPVSSRRSPVSRPVRHLGPPPGFTRLPPKHVHELISSSNPMIGNQKVDDYRWLDAYQLPSLNGIGMNNPMNTSYQRDNRMPGTIRNQNPRAHFQLENQNQWQHHQPLLHLKQEHQLYDQQHIVGIQEILPLPDQYQEKNLWTGPQFG